MADANIGMPGLAAVTPRGHRLRSKACLPIQQLLLPVITSKITGTVLLTARPGGGKTTAIRHLRAVFPDDGRVAFFDVHQAAQALEAAASRLVVLAASETRLGRPYVDGFELS